MESSSNGAIGQIKKNLAQDGVPVITKEQMLAILQRNEEKNYDAVARTQMDDLSSLDSFAAAHDDDYSDDDDAPPVQIGNFRLLQDNLIEHLAPNIVGDAEPIIKFRTYCEYRLENDIPLTESEVRAIKLMSTLLKKRATLDTCEAAMRWFLETTGQHSGPGSLRWVHGHHSRDVIINKLAVRYGFKQISAEKLCKKKEVVLPSSGAKVDLVYHEFGDLVTQLLTDPRFSDEDFLHFNQDPLAGPPDDLDYIGDINTGAAYRETHKKLITDPRRQMLVPVLLCIDAAVTGQFDKCPVEALKMTLGMLNRKVSMRRNVLMSHWKALGV